MQDGLKYMEENKGKFDVVITDSSDPVGPANVLFDRRYVEPPDQSACFCLTLLLLLLLLLPLLLSYYELLLGALNENGVLCSQGESVWLHLQLIRDMMGFCRELYPVVDYAFTSIPTYPRCTKAQDTKKGEKKRNERTNERKKRGEREGGDVKEKKRFVSSLLHRSRLV